MPADRDEILLLLLFSGGSLTMQLFGRAENSPPRKIVLPPPSLNAGDRVDSYVEDDQPSIRTEARDASIKILHHPQKLRAGKHMRASRKRR